MTVTRASFLAAFPVYTNTPTGLIDARLAEAQRRVGPLWGDLQDDGVSYLTAHLLAIDPMGESAARSNAMNGALNYGRTTYLVEFERLQSFARCDMFGTVGG